MTKSNRFYYVYRLIKKKHPNWSKSQIRNCTIYAVKH